MKAGIIDPTKVVRSALQQAASVGSLMIPTEAMVAERPERRVAMGGSPGGGWVAWTSKMTQHDRPDATFDAAMSRLLRRDALRRAIEELNTTSPRGLEDVLARISAEVTADANARMVAHTARLVRGC